MSDPHHPRHLMKNSSQPISIPESPQREHVGTSAFSPSSLNSDDMASSPSSHPFGSNALSPCCFPHPENTTFTTPMKGKSDDMDLTSQVFGPWTISDRELGEGTTGRVCHAVNAQGVEAAAKIVKKSLIQTAREIRNEYKILQKLNHPNIVKTYGLEESETFLTLFTEFVPLGDLYSYVEKNGPLPLPQIQKILGQMVEALFYLHVQKQICHHDIKLENIVVDHEMNAKLVDFGYAIDCSSILHPDKRIRAFHGSPAYSAPEVLFRNPHSKSCDVYSLGVCLYFMFVGKFPFCDESSTFSSLCKKVKQNIVFFPNTIPFHARELISRMLCVENRISLTEIQQHPFFLL